MSDKATDIKPGAIAYGRKLIREAPAGSSAAAAGRKILLCYGIDPDNNAEQASGGVQ